LADLNADDAARGHLQLFSFHSRIATVRITSPAASPRAAATAWLYESELRAIPAGTVRRDCRRLMDNFIKLR